MDSLLDRLRRVQFLRWFYPGMGVKRWLLTLLVGVTIIALGIAYFLREVYAAYTFPAFVYYLTLQFLPRYVRGVLFLSVGLGLVGFALWQLQRSLLGVVMSPADDSLVNILYNRRYLLRGPKVVAIGGGTGLSTLLRGLKEHTANLTAIVTVADDGGSSGVLRRELGILPPGDFRSCIAALADAEPLVTRLFQYRFGEGSGLEGHSFGNLFIVAMSGVTGNFERAISESSRVLSVRGRILPSTLANVTLNARTEDEATVRGESNIPRAGARIGRVYLEPENPQAYPEAVRAIMEADLIVLGPGSLYTSVLPNLLVRGIVRAIRASAALRVYVCNIATQRGETDGYSVGDHLEALQLHAGEGFVEYVLANGTIDERATEGLDVTMVSLGGTEVKGAKLLVEDLVSEENRLRHDPQKLSSALMRLYYRRDMGGA